MVPGGPKLNGGCQTYGLVHGFWWAHLTWQVFESTAGTCSPFRWTSLCLRWGKVCWGAKGKRHKQRQLDNMQIKHACSDSGFHPCVHKLNNVWHLLWRWGHICTQIGWKANRMYIIAGAHDQFVIKEEVMSCFHRFPKGKLVLSLTIKT